MSLIGCARTVTPRVARLDLSQDGTDVVSKLAS
jgi:hypothetical protein